MNRTVLKDPEGRAVHKLDCTAFGNAGVQAGPTSGVAVVVGPRRLENRRSLKMRIADMGLANLRVLS